MGCRDPPQTWCTEVGRIYLFQYGIAMFLLAVGYPAANLITYAIFSKILGPFPQVCVSVCVCVCVCVCLSVRMRLHACACVCDGLKFEEGRGQGWSLRQLISLLYYDPLPSLCSGYHDGFPDGCRQPGPCPGASHNHSPLPRQGTCHHLRHCCRSGRRSDRRSTNLLSKTGTLQTCPWL